MAHNLQSQSELCHNWIRVTVCSKMYIAWYGTTTKLSPTDKIGECCVFSDISTGTLTQIYSFSKVFPIISNIHVYWHTVFNLTKPIRGRIQIFKIAVMRRVVIHVALSGYLSKCQLIQRKQIRYDQINLLFHISTIYSRLGIKGYRPYLTFSTNTL